MLYPTQTKRVLGGDVGITLFVGPFVFFVSTSLNKWTKIDETLHSFSVGPEVCSVGPEVCSIGPEVCSIGPENVQEGR